MASNGNLVLHCPDGPPARTLAPLAECVVYVRSVEKDVISQVDGIVHERPGIPGLPCRVTLGKGSEQLLEVDVVGTELSRGLCRSVCSG